MGPPPSRFGTLNLALVPPMTTLSVTADQGREVKNVFSKWVLAACVVLTLISMAATGCASAEDAATENAQTETVSPTPRPRRPRQRLRVAEGVAEAKAEAKAAAKAEAEPRRRPTRAKAEAEAKAKADAETAGQENARGSAGVTSAQLVLPSGPDRPAVLRVRRAVLKADANLAVDHIDVDWNEQAANSPDLEHSSFSRRGLIDQLSSEYGEQFTHEQAVYGVNQTGL